MSTSIVIAAAAAADLQPAPVPPDWILSGTPEARNRELAKSADRTSWIIVWNCTAGRFNWHYMEDETLVIISGEAFITDERGEERRLGPGDTGFFPAGASCVWRITDHVRKVAVVRQAIPRPLVFVLRVWNRLLRSLGLARRSPLMQPRLPHPAGM